MTKDHRPKARAAKGFRDIPPDEIRGLRKMLGTIQQVYESYGFEPVEQPFIEYTDALGKFLPDQDRPNAGVFSFQDDDDQWLSLRYDLTAPLARYVAENQQKLPTPYRSYRQGWVFRNEKPGPGRHRQFMQFDADTVGSASPAADAEVCMMAADTMEALGLERGQYVVRVSNRKVLDGIKAACGIADSVWLTVLRALDKFDRLGVEGVRLLLGNGRKDESGDFTPGAELSNETISALVDFVNFQSLIPYLGINSGVLETLRSMRFNVNQAYNAGIEELDKMVKLFDASGYDGDRVRIDTSVVRGLEYYTGPVFECELLMETKDDDGRTVRFGSVGGGGRYDDLVARFTGQPVPATGFSIGVSRLYSALKLVGKAEGTATLAPVVVLMMDREHPEYFQKMVMDLRNAGIRAEMHFGTVGMKAQMKYADKRGSPIAVIQGSDERAKGEVTLKDLIEGAKAAAAIKDNKDWKSARPAQVAVAEDKLVDAVREILDRHA